MNYLAHFLLFITFLYCIISWVIPQLLAWFFKRKYKIVLKVGRFIIHKLILKDVTIIKNGYTIHIEEISFHSSLTNSEVKKIISLIIRDVRVNKDVVEKKPVKNNSGIFKPLLSKQNSLNNVIPTNTSEPTNDILNDVSSELSGFMHNTLDFRDMELPASIRLFTQFLAVKIYNLSLMVLRAEEGIGANAGWLCHATAESVQLDGTGTAGHLTLSGSIEEACAKLLRRAPDPQRLQTCLAEVSFCVNLEVLMLVDSPLNVERVQCIISTPTAIINEGIYKFLHEKKTYVNKSTVPAHTSPNVPIDGLFHRIAPIIPKNFSFKINGSTVTAVRENTCSDYCISLQNLQVNARFSASPLKSLEQIDSMEIKPYVKRLPQVYLVFQMDQLKINSNKEKIFFLSKLKLEAKLINEELIVYVILDTLTITYAHEDIYEWISTYFLTRNLDLIPNSIPIEEMKSSTPIPRWLVEFCDICVIQICAELRNVSLGVKWASHATTFAYKGLKVKLDQLTDLRCWSYESNLARLILGMRHWSTELLIDSAWLQVGSGDIPNKKSHTFGTGFFIGVALVKWGSHGTIGSKIEAMLDCIRLEGSPSVANTLIHVIECINDYSKNRLLQPRTRSVNSDDKLLVNVTLTNLNLFALTQDNICLICRIETVMIEKNISKIGFVVSGFKIADIVPSNKVYMCQRIDEMNDMFCYISLARIDYQSNVITVQLLELVNVYWSTNLHLKCLAVIKEIKQFKNDICKAFKITSKPKETSEQSENHWFVTFKGDVGAYLKLSDRHKLLFNFDDITFGRDSGGFSIVWNLCHIAIDDAQIFTIKGFTMKRIHNSANIREERQNADGFILKWNKTWSVTILSFCTIFPHQHNFAEAIQDEFVSLTKWIKLVHNHKKKPFTSDSPLPSDLYIQVDEFILEMTDDPFEVKLRDNYELLEDEYKEGLKRKSMLDNKVAELCKTKLSLPTGKVEELYAGLVRRNAQIYIQRSRQLSRGTSGRALATCRFVKLRILALADPTLHGTANCIKNLQELDQDSPWPAEGLEFTTLWCRWVTSLCSEWCIQLRDFPQPLLCATSLHLWGILMGAEQSPPPRARRTTIIDQGAPWGTKQIERSMTSLKFYHDLNCEMDQFRYAFGPCWEPIIAQCNLSWEQVISGSRDPSASLPWWDKMRLLMHGRLMLCVQKLSLLLHASLDPYNTTEEMELAWSDLVLDWTNAKFVFNGELKVHVRTASKYDDCHLLQFRNLRLTVKLSWLCLADPNDHHCVIQCAPDKIPEYSINQEHDSFRAFRSQSLGIHLSFETKPTKDNFCPRLLFYGSTLRWFESLKQILSGATRPTRRGTVFNNTRPRRPQLSRHYQNARLSLALHCFQATYWVSVAKQRGVDIIGQRITCGSQHTLVFIPTRDGLIRRSRSTWPPLYINCELNVAEVWFSLHEDNKDSNKDPNKDFNKDSNKTADQLVRYYCLSVSKVSYGRESAMSCHTSNNTFTGENPPTHHLVVHDLKGAWTKTNRDIAFALFDAYMKNKQLKKNLSTEALKLTHPDDADNNIQTGRASELSTLATPPTTTSIHTSGGQTQALLAQLVAEADHKSIVYSESEHSEVNSQPPPHATICAIDDSSHCNWLIALVNAQVVLRGCETKGYVVLCAARAEVRQRLKRSCSTWAGSLQSMQYYATVSARDNLHLHENIQWVSVEEIEEKGSILLDMPSLVGSGHSAGGVLGSTVGPCNDQAYAPQLQRIVSRCRCEFYYVGYEESVGSNEVNRGNAWDEPNAPCDSFTLMHHDLDVCTNSLQYAMLLDVVNNLVLYVEPQRKRALERLARMRFQMQLHRVSDPRRPIQLLQNQVRALVARLRNLEREAYLKKGNATHEQELQRQVLDCKEQLTKDGEELHAMVACFQESRYRATPATQTRPAAPVRTNEIYFKHAQWRLTDADGQLGIADLVLSNFQYTKNTKSDDSVEHLLELGDVRMTNLLPNEAYSEVLVPTENKNRKSLARKRVLRVFCRERPPVGGISVKEHFEINVVPITIGLTKKFFNNMLKFCFPERDPDKIEEGTIDNDDASSSTGILKSENRNSTKKSKSKKHGKDSSFYVAIEQKDDVEKMKERAEKNKLFIYIKIPEVPVRVSYKGNKEKNLEDLRDISIVIPTLEYHNVTWTWLDLLLAMKSDSKKVILSQAIRQKLQIHRNRGGITDGNDDSESPQEEDKARMLFGDRRVVESKPQKKGVPLAFKPQK